MLWHNKFQDDETMNVTSGLFIIMFNITSSLNILQVNYNHNVLIKGMKKLEE